MSDVMTKKLNNGFVMRPYSFFQDGEGSHPTRSETLIRGWIYSMTRTEGQVCRFGYSNFMQKFGLSRSTVARATRKLRSGGVISARRIGGQASVYNYISDVSKTAHVRTELWFFTTIFKIGGLDRYLTNAEVDVLSLIYTHTRYEAAKHYEGSVREIAGILNISEKTVMRAIAALFAADLISRPTIGLNRHQKSVFVANMRVLRRLDKAVKKAEKAATQAQDRLPAHVQAANARADRDRFYAERTERCRQLVDHFTAKVARHPRFNDVERGLRILGLELAKAEIYTPEQVPNLQGRLTALQKERALILDMQGVEAWQLEEKSHAICKTCFDTGYRSDGTGCSCYSCR